MLNSRPDSFWQARRDARSAGNGARCCYAALNAFVIGTLGASHNELTAEITRGEYLSAIVFSVMVLVATVLYVCTCRADPGYVSVSDSSEDEEASVSAPDAGARTSGAQTVPVYNRHVAPDGAVTFDYVGLTDGTVVAAPLANLQAESDERRNRLGATWNRSDKLGLIVE